MDHIVTLNNQICFAIYELSSEVNKLYTKALHPFQLTYPQYLVLLALWEQDHQNVKQLGAKLGIGTGTLTPMLKRMEAQQYVYRNKDKQDERIIIISLTEQAISRKEAIIEATREQLIDCNITLNEYEHMLAQLHELKHKLQARKA